MTDSVDRQVDEYLSHYGVKGMRWGVRKRSPRRVLQEAREKRPGGDAKKLTDAELGERIKRLEAEKRYKDLSARTVSRGEKIAVDIMTQVGTQTAVKVGNGALALGAQIALNRQMKGLGDAVVPKQKTPKFLKDKIPSKRG
mgnify:CR=1 FL=1